MGARACPRVLQALHCMRSRCYASNTADLCLAVTQLIRLASLDHLAGTAGGAAPRHDAQAGALRHAAGPAPAGGAGRAWW